MPTASAHRRYQVVRAMFFEHVLHFDQLLRRLAFRAAGEGDDDRRPRVVGTLARFFPRALAGLVCWWCCADDLFIDLRYGLLLIVLCLVFALLIALVILKSERLQANSRTTIPGSPNARRHAGKRRPGRLRPYRHRSIGVRKWAKMSERPDQVLSWWAAATVLTPSLHYTHHAVDPRFRRLFLSSASPQSARSSCSWVMPGC